MGSISLQSVQVPAKNSTKIRSLCLGIKLEAEVWDGTSGSEIAVRADVEGIAVAETFSGEATQENKSRELAKTNKWILCITYIH
jgi:hypothetical protein